MRPVEQYRQRGIRESEFKYENEDLERDANGTHGAGRDCLEYMPPGRPINIRTKFCIGACGHNITKSGEHHRG